MRHLYLNVAVVVVSITLYSCSANLLPFSVKKSTDQAGLEKKGRDLLLKSVKQQGFENFNTKETYEFTAEDHWKGPMGGIGKLWSKKRSKMNFKYIPNTFNASVEFLDGKDVGNKAGLQSWNYYRVEKGEQPNFEVKKAKRHVFGMAAFQYFTELTQRLSKAPIIRYAGEKVINDLEYDVVYCTWETIYASKEHDQYLVYINKKTNAVEYASYTIRDNYLKMPGSGVFYGSIHFTDMRNVDGFKVPFQQYIFIGKPKKKDKKYVHKLSLDSFKFDSFDSNELYPNSELKKGGDSK